MSITPAITTHLLLLTLLLLGFNAFVPWFIDGGTIIDHSDPSWSFRAIFKLGQSNSPDDAGMVDSALVLMLSLLLYVLLC